MVDQFQNISSADQKDSSVFSTEAKKNKVAIGNSGTEIYGGVFSEEYLSKLQSTEAAKEYDKMRRSEPQIAMLLNAVKNPIKAATWSIESAGDEADQRKHAELIESILKKQINWEKFLHEALTFIDFGHSVFEVVHNIVSNNKKFGAFNGLAQLGFRAQKSLYYWQLKKETGEIEHIEQWTMSDVGVTSRSLIPGEFCLVFSLQQEGDNYEGISALRPLYGPYVRKNLYQRLNAIGIEKYAIGTPIGTLPEGMDAKSPDYEQFKNVLRAYTSHETAFIIVPHGYEIDVKKGDFDASKIKEVILLENTEMVNAFVANFLALGMNGNGGAFALGSDLSDFFLSGIQQFANIICGQLNRKLIPDLVKMNFGEQEAYPEIKCTGINDKAGKELAEVVSSLVGSKTLTPDMKLEEFLRKSYDLPKADESTRAPVAPAPVAPTMQFAEPMSSKDWKKKFKDNQDEISTAMKSGLKTIFEDLKKQIKSKYEAASPADKIKVPQQVETKGATSYQATIKELLAKTAFRATKDASKEVPKSVRLSEKFLKLADEPRGGYYAALPANIRKLIDAQSYLISSTQIADLEKMVFFQFVSSANSTDSIDTILNDIDERVLKVLDGDSNAGMSLDTAAANAVAETENQARLEFFFEPDVLDTIESFTFTNEDPISEICQELAGQTFAVGDPDLDRYSPPLHHNCKSRLVPNLKGDSGNPEIDRGGVSLSPGALKSITLGEKECCKPTYKLI